jgi:Cu/Ag efflux pump CusA
MRSTVGASLRFPLVAIAIAAAMILLGVITLRQMPLDVLPEFAPPFVEVQTEAAGLSASEVEALLTVPLEEALTGSAQLETMRSRSVPGLSSILMIFEPGTDVLEARQVVQERLLTRTLPAVSQPPVMLQPLSATSRVMLISLESDELPLIEQSVLARWKIRPALMGVPGVANVSIWGQRAQQLQVQVDPARMAAQGVTLDDVIHASGDALWVSPLSFLNASYPGSGGWIDTPQQRIGVRHILPISTPADLAQVVVKVVDGEPVHLGDIGEVVEGHPPLIGEAVGQSGSGLLLVVEKFPWVNTLEVTRNIDAAMTELLPALPGLRLDTTVFRPATFINEAIGNLSWGLAIGALLLLAFLAVTNWRVALISIVAIPLSLVTATLVLYWMGQSINIMVLAGFLIAAGLVVDDAIVDVEHAIRRLRERNGEGADRSVAAVVAEASVEIRGTLAYATLIAVLAILPVFFLEGLAGSFFGPLALSYTLAVLASVVVALAVTPAVAVFILTRGPAIRRDLPIRNYGRRARVPARPAGLQRVYEFLLSGALRRVRSALAFAAVIVALLGIVGVVTGAAAPQGTWAIVPPFRDRDLMITWEAAPGTSEPAMTRITSSVTEQLGSIHGVRRASAHIGRAEQGDQIVGINSGEIWVSLDPAVDYDTTVEAIAEALDGYPGMRHNVQTYFQDRTREVVSGGDQAITARLYGPDLTTLRGIADEAVQRISGVEGAVDVAMESQVNEPHIRVKVDLARAEPYGLSPGDVRRAAASLVGGIQVGSLFEEQKVFDVVVWSTPPTRNDLTSFREMLIDTPSGEQVRLADVADVEVTSTPTEIRHEATSLRIDIGLNVAPGSNPDAVARDVEAALQQIDFPLEYHAQLLGEYAERTAAQQRLLALAAASAIGILLLLQAAFGSWRLAAVALLILPIAPLGGALAGLATGSFHTLGVPLGIFAVFAIATRHVVLLIRHYQWLEHEEGEPFGLGLILRGARERLMPMLLSAGALALAVTPFLIFGDLPGYEVARPMAIAILGGLVTSTLLSLFIVPAVYLHAGPRPVPDEATELIEQPGLSPA